MTKCKNDVMTPVKEAGRLTSDLHLPSSLLQIQCPILTGLCGRPPAVASPPLPFLTIHSPLIMLSQSAMPAGLLGELASRACQRGKQAREVGGQASDLHSLSSPPNPILQSHPQLCNRLAIVESRGCYISFRETSLCEWCSPMETP